MARSHVTRHGKDCTSVFDLLGHDENDLTAALGFTLARSDRFLAAVVKRVLPGADVGDAQVRMEARDEQGRTDLEIETSANLVVVEAKRGWLLPSVDQLESYAERGLRHGRGVLVTLSDCSQDWAKLHGATSANGVPVRHLPWSEVQADLLVARTGSRGVERTWLDELHDYLQRAIRMRDPEDSMTYCVVVSRSRPGDGGTRDFMDFVLNEAVYFHPFGSGSGWPTTAPNFMAFRWDNKVQRVCRVLRHEVIPDLQTRWPDIPADDETTKAHVVYHLGPPLRMERLPTGQNYRANRMWVLLDQLFTCSTLAEAITHTGKLLDPEPTSKLRP